MDINTLLDEFKKLKVLVVGDVSLDLYCYYDPELSEPSRETNIPNTPCVKRVLSPGAGGNVAKNISLLGAKTYLISVCGDDGFGIDLKRIMWDMYKLPKSCIIEDTGKITFTYTKLINKNTGKEDRGRLDFIEENPISHEAEEKVLDKLKRLIPVVDAIAIVDQKETPVPGVITENVRKFLHHEREKYPDKIFIVDSRIRPHLFKGMIEKPNDKEFIRLYNGLFNTHKSPVNILSFTKRYAIEVSERIKAPLYITFSDMGTLYVDYKSGEIYKIFAKKVKPYDITGAGDAFLAGLILSLSITRDPVFSVKVANIVASISVMQKGTGKVTPADVKSSWEDLPVIKIISPDIEILNPSIERGKVKHVIFDFDGTISTLREGWEGIMELFMVEMITGGRKDQEVEKEVKEFIEKTTGIQTILQMEGLLEMIKKFGYIPKDEIKDAMYYKKLYRERILSLVRERIKRVKEGEVPLDFYLIKGVKDFLKKLKNKGLTLYLASGTDREDVIYEAKFLKIDGYFTGGIYGSLDDVDKYSKYKVMREIIEKYNLEGPELLVFGDGPVEIKSAKEYNGIAIGVASFEKNGRGGWNLQKIKRLKSAGVDILIPDFTVGDLLIKPLPLGVGI